MIGTIGYMYAQEPVPNHGPDLQRADGGIFDPTREEKKVEVYQFAVEYRVEAGYVQHNHRSTTLTYPDGYMHGGRVGMTFDFMLPKHFSIQTGLLYTITYGEREQHWGEIDASDIYGSTNYLKHRLTEHQLTIPVRAYINIPLVSKFRMFFYGGPQLHIGVALQDNVLNRLSPMTTDWFVAHGKQVEPYDKYKVNELHRANIQMGIGGGFEWDIYRLQAGYDFGLNNLVKTKLCSDQQMWEWSWFVSFAVKFK